MPLIRSESNLYDESTGRKVRLMGLSLQDPLWQRLAPGVRLLPHGPANLEHAKSWGANAVRLPFHPATIRYAGRGDWLRGLDEVASELDWILLAARALDLWVVIDFHAIGFPADESAFEFDEEPFENIYACSQFEIESFWRHVASRYGEHPQVAAFELYNEASRGSDFGNETDWDLHATWAENLLRDIIRPKASKMLAVVGGLHFGYDLEWALKRPIKDSNLAYSSHPYPHHSQAKTWDRAFARLARTYPVILTELGFTSDGFFGRHHHRGYRDWELEIQSLADSLGLSFFAWNFSSAWEPALLKPTPNQALEKEKSDFDLGLEPNEAGLFFRTWFEEATS